MHLYLIATLNNSKLKYIPLAYTDWEADTMAVACMQSCFSCVRLFVTLWTIVHQAPLSLGSPGKNTRVGCHAHLQGIFLTQISKPYVSHLLHWQADSLPLSHLGSPTVAVREPTLHLLGGQMCRVLEMILGVLGDPDVGMEALSVLKCLLKYQLCVVYCV